MTEIILSTTPTSEEIVTELIQLKVIAPTEDWEGLYDQLQVFRSTQGDGGPFEELTAANWSRPRLPTDGGDQPASPVTGASVVVVGDVLSVQLSSGFIVSITFTGSDPLTLSQVATQISAQGMGLVTSYVDATGKLVVEGTLPGLSSTIQILETDGAVALGLPLEQARGRDARPTLLPNTTYTILDPYGSRDYAYRTRFINSRTLAQSEFSISYGLGKGLGLPSDEIILGYAYLVGNNGEAYEGGEVRVYTEFDGLLTTGRVVAGGDVVKLTDENGRVEFQLVRGHKVTVAFQGTSIVRTITVPTDPTLESFNLLDPTISDSDVFKAVVPDIITAERRSL